jgi:uncharacterized protein YyaL (SSP411 family)
MALDNPSGLGQSVCVLDRLARGAVSIVLVGDAASTATRALADVAFREYLPSRVVAVVDPARPETAEVAKALAEGKPARPGETVAYVCRGRACAAPVATPGELKALLR